MAHDRRKDDLKKLLVFLQNIIREPDNSWFVEALYSILPPKKADDNSLDKIEKYLGLDYNIDGQIPLIDFSFIQNEYLRECFKADYREMLRCRFGTRAHKVDFTEYCRFALIIAERAINLYYSIDVEFDTIRNHISEYNKTAKIDTAKSLREISFSVKLWSFCNQYNLSSIKESLDRVREVRNLKSHGAVLSEDEGIWFQKTSDSFKNAGFPLRYDGTVDWRTLKDMNLALWNYYETEIKNTPAHKKVYPSSLGTTTTI